MSTVKSDPATSASSLMEGSSCSGFKASRANSFRRARKRSTWAGSAVTPAAMLWPPCRMSRPSQLRSAAARSNPSMLRPDPRHKAPSPPKMIAGR